MEKFFGAEKWSHELRNTILKETGLPISWGLATNKMLSKMCTQDGKPNGTYVIKAGEEQAYLDTKHVGTIPFVGEKMVQSLEKMRIRTIAELRTVDVEVLTKLFGKHGLWLWQKSTGIDLSTVQNEHEEKSISSERTFETNISDEKELKHILFKLCEKLSFELRINQKQTGCITVKIRHSNFETVSHQHQIIPEFSTPVLFKIITQLFDQMWGKTGHFV